jgi:hypothetical protein
VKGAVKGCEILETSQPPEPEHGPVPSSEWLAGILGPVVQPSADMALADRADGFQFGAA